MRLFRLLPALLLLLPAVVFAQDTRPLFTEDFTPEEFAARRAKVYDAIGPAAIAIVQGEPTPRGYVRFRQSNQFYYLSGIEAAHAYLLMDGARRTTTVYLPHRDARRERSEGTVLSADIPDRVRALTGIDAVAALETLPTALGGYQRGTIRTVYLPMQPAEGLAESRDLGVRRITDRLADPFDARPAREALMVQQMSALFPVMELADLSPILDQLRMIKSDQEIEMIHRATRLSGLAIMEAMRSAEPGVVERELDAVARFIYFRHGAQGDAYYSLVASGSNAPFPHYHAGVKTLESGEMLLMDYAPDVGYYMSDVTRMMPVDGRFTPEHRQLYEVYDGFYQAILTRIRVGVTPNEIKREAVVEMRSILAATSFLKPIYETAARGFVDSYERGAASGYGGRLGHFVGMATHDVGILSGPLEAGMVFTIEPALRVPEENLYIRSEDVIVITADGADILSDFVPSSIEAIEALMAEPGLLQKYQRDPEMKMLGAR